VALAEPLVRAGRGRDEVLIDAYHELCCYTLAHPGAAFIHQHVVDAFMAQQANAATKPVGLTFALIGLFLHVEKHVTGKDVQRVHMRLGRRRQTWPTWALPAERGTIRPEDVMAAPPGPERDAAIDAWCASVWSAYANHRSAIEDLLRANGERIDHPPARHSTG
jgi:hypothetical protein